MLQLMVSFDCVTCSSVIFVAVSYNMTQSELCTQTLKENNTFLTLKEAFQKHFRPTCIVIGFNEPKLCDFNTNQIILMLFKKI